MTTILFNILFISLSINLLIISIGKLIDMVETKKLNKHQQFILNTSLHVDCKEILETFDLFVNIIFEKYLNKNIQYKQLDYINSDMEEVMFREVSKLVMNTISNILITKLSLIYKIDTEEDLANIITDTVNNKILEFSINIKTLNNEKK